MEKTHGCVLKADHVNIQGTVRLDAGRAPQKQNSAAGSVVSTPQVGIIEKKGDFAVIEVTCSCGTKTRIRCEYGNTTA